MTYLFHASVGMFQPIVVFPGPCSMRSTLMLIGDCCVPVAHSGYFAPQIVPHLSGPSAPAYDQLQFGASVAASASVVLADVDALPAARPEGGPGVR
jgi:hypothetical protein